MTTLTVLTVSLLVANALGLRYGADSRDGRDWHPLGCADLRPDARPDRPPVHP